MNKDNSYKGNSEADKMQRLSAWFATALRRVRVAPAWCPQIGLWTPGLYLVSGFRFRRGSEDTQAPPNRT